MTEHDPSDKSAAATFDAIRSGSQHLLMVGRGRIAEAEAALDRGAFHDAMTHLGEASSMLGPLANAERYIAIADGSYLSRVADLEVGMTLTDIGEVTAIERVEECEDCGDPHVNLTIRGQERSYESERLVYVVRAP